MHVVELEIGIRREERRAVHAAPIERAARLIGIEMRPHGNQVRLRQPRNAQRRPEVHGGAVRGPDRDARISALRILTDRPSRKRLRANVAEPVHGDRLHPSGDSIDHFADPTRKPVEPSTKRFERRRPDPETRKIAAVEIGGEPAQHRRRGIEVSQRVLDSHPALLVMDP